METEPAKARLKKLELRRVVIRIVVVIAAAIGVVVAIKLLLLAGVPLPPQVDNVVYALVTFLGLASIVRQFANTLRKADLPSPSTATAMWNIVRLTGYMVAVLLALSVFGVSPEVLFATGAFGGIVIGLGLQPVLVNFFAGLIIIFGKYVTPGMEISILTANVNVGATLHPHNRFVPRDFLYGGYRGRVLDVGLLYSSLVTADELEVRISNGLLLNAAIVDHRSGVNHVRYGFGIDHSPETVLAKVGDALAEVPGIVSVNIDEHLDKENYFIVITFRAASGEDWRETKSKILARLIEVQRDLARAMVPAFP